VKKNIKIWHHFFQDERMAHEMQERPASANAKRPHYVRAGSKDSMEVSRCREPLLKGKGQYG